jgi:hypothetical protein
MKTIRNAETDQKADAVGARRLVITLWLGFFSYVAACFLIIPEWTGITRDVWLIITLVIFAGAVVYVILTLAAYAPAEDLEPRRNVPKPTTHATCHGGQALRGGAHA